MCYCLDHRNKDGILVEVQSSFLTRLVAILEIFGHNRLTLTLRTCMVPKELTINEALWTKGSL